jgi:HEAT repeat protein
MPPKNVCARLLALVAACATLALSVPAETQSLETLLAYLKSPIAKTRRDAAHKLGERRARNQLAVEALTVAARKDEDAEVRREAVRSLGMIKDFAAVPEMLDALKDENTDVRREAVRSLVALYTEHNIDFIVNRRVGWNRFNPLLDTNDSEIIEPYQRVDPSIITHLGDTARGDGDLGIRIAAIRALGVLRGWGAIDQLGETLNADQDVRIDVIRAFIKIGDASAGRFLVPFFRDSNQKVRTQAMVAAGLLRYKPAVEPLLSIYGLGPEKEGTITKVARKVSNPFAYNPTRDEAALWALALIGDEKAEQTFVENMNDRDDDRRRYAMEGLARIGEARYLDQISKIILTERDGDARLAEHWALYRMGSRPNIQFIVNKLDTDQAEQAREYLMEVVSPADLYPYLQSSNKTVRREVIAILGRIGNQETIRELEPIARSSGAETANAATLAIKRIEWRVTGRPRAEDEVLRREDIKRRAANPWRLL